MIFPNYLKEKDIIGVTACSCGVLSKIDKYEKSIANFSSNGFKIIETDNVRTDGVVSSDGVTRARELESLFLDNDVKMVSIARGGDFLYEMLPEVNFDILKNNTKWLSGSSDPTSLLYILTTNYDIATIYSPCNMTGFDSETLHPSLTNYFKVIKGEVNKQERYPFREGQFGSEDYVTPNIWNNINGDVLEEGILIGGCVDCLKDVIGTRFDKTSEFLEKYKEEGFIWYLDVFGLSSEVFYNTLLQFKNAGWFKYAKAIVIGKICFPNTCTGLSYEELIKKALPNIKVIFNFDVGHIGPSFTMINGAKVRLVSNEEEGSLEFLK